MAINNNVCGEEGQRARSLGDLGGGAGGLPGRGGEGSPVQGLHP